MGRTVVFTSFAGNLVPGITTIPGDVFLVRLGGPTATATAWTMIGRYYFDTLGRDGAGDLMATGRRMATSSGPARPHQPGLGLPVILVRSLASGTTTLIWPAAPGRAYRPQFRNGLGDPAGATCPDQSRFRVDGLGRDEAASGSTSVTTGCGSRKAHLRPDREPSQRRTRYESPFDFRRLCHCGRGSP